MSARVSFFPWEVSPLRLALFVALTRFCTVFVQSVSTQPSSITWFTSRLNPSLKSKNGEADRKKRKRKVLKEHALRTAEWEISYRGGESAKADPIRKLLSFGAEMMGSFNGNKTMKQDTFAATTMTFKRNGRCAMMNPLIEINDRFEQGEFTIMNFHGIMQTQLGEWRLEHGRVLWDVPVYTITVPDFSGDVTIFASAMKQQGETLGDLQKLKRKHLTVLHFVAEVHLNKFGEKPRMCKGVVTRDRIRSSFLPKKLFRPIVATFTAEGVGEDTVDIFYKSRGLGLQGR